MSAVRRGKAAVSGVGERTERRHVLAVHRRDARDLHGFLRQLLQRVGAGVVAGRGAAPPPDPHRGGDAEVLGAPARGDAVVGEARVRFHRALHRDAASSAPAALACASTVSQICERFVAGEHHAAPVFRTVTLRNRAGGQP